MRPMTHNLIDDQRREIETTSTYKKAIENVEKSIAEKLNISLPEAKVMLNYKKNQKTREKSVISLEIELEELAREKRRNI